MSVFAQINARIGASRRFTHIESHVGRVYAEVMEKTINTSFGRGPEYRPSSFPICPVLVHAQFVKAAYLGFYESNMNTGGGYFTSVGTAAHENIQYYMGETGSTFGDWKCRNPRCQKHHDARDLYDEKGNITRPGKLTRENTCKNTCPKCKNPMEYVEKCINYNGLKGHIDCIFKMPDGSYWIVDYKTTTKGILKSNKLPKREHLMQVPTYCYVLEKKYGMKISGFSLLYFSRDNPYEFREYAEQWAPRRRDEIKKLIKAQKEIYRASVNSFLKNDPDIAIKKKPCQCPDDYERLMPAYDACPMESVCFHKPTLRKALLHDLKPEQLITVLNITNNMEKYADEMPVAPKPKIRKKHKAMLKNKVKRITKQ